MARQPPPDLTLVQRLLDAGLTPTRQRLAVAELMLSAPQHLSAEQVLKHLAERYQTAPTAIESGVSSAVYAPRVSRATVYAALAQLARAGLLRELRTGTGPVIYDSNPSHHPHWVDMDTGEVHDLPGDARLTVHGTETLPADLHVEDVQVMLMVRRRPTAD